MLLDTIVDSAVLGSTDPEGSGVAARGTAINIAGGAGISTFVTGIVVEHPANSTKAHKGMMYRGLMAYSLKAGVMRYRQKSSLKTNHNSLAP